MITFKAFRDGIQQGVYKVINPSVKVMIKIGVTPNMITTIGFLGNLVAAALFIYSALYVPANDFSVVGWAGFLILFSSLFDMIDGYLARTGNMCSTFGAFYDSVLDRFCELFTLSGIAFYFMKHGYEMATVVTFLSLIGSIMVSYVRARAEGLDIECKVGLMQRPERVVVTSLGAIFCGLLADSVSFDPTWILLVPQILIAVLANYTVIVRILHVKKQMGK
ncbi:MAG: CDP-alcohol phosphatidyltransferase family protein [Bacteroidaceae bacterium]|nr:CDP-alcohol phosphatidyltransferase family protein [Bacteroidaceae bacterium]